MLRPWQLEGLVTLDMQMPHQTAAECNLTARLACTAKCSPGADMFQHGHAAQAEFCETDVLCLTKKTACVGFGGY